MSDSDTTYALLELLRWHHKTRNAGEWATFEELAEAPIGGQRIDYFAIHTWRSKKYKAIAYEVKASRSDFRKELRDPYKRSYAELVSNESYFVAPAGLLKPAEIPDGWGLMEPRVGSYIWRDKTVTEQRLVVVKPAIARPTVKWSTHFIVSIARYTSSRAINYQPALLPNLELEPTP